jgi:hypothetical protein
MRPNQLWPWKTTGKTTQLYNQRVQLKERKQRKNTGAEYRKATQAAQSNINSLPPCFRSVRPEAACRAPPRSGGTHMRGPLCSHSRQRASMHTARTQAGIALLLSSRCKRLTVSQGRARRPACGTTQPGKQDRLNVSSTPVVATAYAAQDNSTHNAAVLKTKQRF